mmetsp:Transcript_41260/g.50189  ORF Transcript_41260/g.50189 Transcript_41260/m.50189 type:complete len:279 (+) Transcript_41260:40-876(+)
MGVLAAFQSVALFHTLSAALQSSSTTQIHSNTMAPACENNNPTPPRLSSILPPLAKHSRRIYLLRHGETDWNASGKIQGSFDIPLNENGQRQAVAVAAHLDDIPIGVVASSHLSRAKETADTLWKNRHSTTAKPDVIVDASFAEMSFGELEGLVSRDPDLDPMTKRRFSTVTERVQRDIDFAFPGGGESTAQVEKRAKRALYRILKNYPEEKHIAIVSHGRTNKVLISSIAFEDVRKFAQVRQSNACINVLDVDENGKWTTQKLNHIEHVKNNVIVRL